MNRVAKKKQMTLENSPEVVSASETTSGRPDIFSFHDYQLFLVEYIRFLKSEKKGFSLRKLALQSGLSSKYLPMVLSGQRPLSQDALKKMMPFLDLIANEVSFLEALHVLGTTSFQEERIEALNRMKRFHQFQKYHQHESEAYEYLTKWYYYTIRELASDPEFQLEARWIQSRLRHPVPLSEIENAIRFLLKHSFLETDPTGKVVPPEKQIRAQGGVYKVALAQYHKDCLSLAAKSIENATSEERYLAGHTFAIPASKFNDVRILIDQTIEKIQDIIKSTGQAPADSVYHMEMALFPLTKTSVEGDSK